MSEKLLLRAAIGVGALYLLAACLLPPSVFWSPDEGGKFLQMLGYHRGGGHGFNLQYGARSLDEALEFYPDWPLYPQPAGSDAARIAWPRWFPLLASFPFGVMGMAGLYVLPLVCGLACVVLTGLLARRLSPQSAVPVLVAAGLGSPLFFYSLVFLEHTLGVFLCLAALHLLATCPDFRARTLIPRMLGSAALLAIASAIRYELLIFALAVLLAGLLAAPVFFKRSDNDLEPRRRIRRLLFWGLGLCGLAFTALHLLELAAGAPAQFPRLGNFVLQGLLRLDQGEAWTGLGAKAAGLLLNDASRNGPDIPLRWQLLGGVGFALCCAAAFRGKARVPLCAAGLLLLSAMSACAVVAPVRFRAVHSLLLPAPYLGLVPVAISLALASRCWRSLFMVSAGPVYVLLYLVAGSLAGIRTGGPEWGARYILPAYCLLAIASGTGFTGLWNAEKDRALRGLLATAGAIALLCGGLFCARSFGELRITKQDLTAFDREIRNRNLPVVTDLPWLGAALAPTFADRPILTCTRNLEFLRRLDRTATRLDRILYVSYHLPDMSDPDAKRFGLRLAEKTEIRGMRFMEYQVKATPGNGTRESSDHAESRTR